MSQSTTEAPFTSIRSVATVKSATYILIGLQLGRAGRAEMNFARRMHRSTDRHGPIDKTAVVGRGSGGGGGGKSLKAATLIAAIAECVPPSPPA